MPSRNKFDLANNQIHYLRRAGETKITYIYSPEQLQEWLDSGRISEDDHVGIALTTGGYNGGRGKKEEVPKEKRLQLSSECPWSYASKAAIEEANEFLQLQGKA